jgi:protein O-GlcNAc transferase
VIDKLLDEAEQQLELGKLEKAEKVLGMIIKADPNCADAHHLLGLIKLKRGLLEQAVTRISRALMLQPESPAYLSNLGLVYTQQQKFESAENCFVQALAYDKQHFSSYINRANLLKRVGRVQEAVEDYQLALDLNPYHLDCLNSFATLLGANGQVDQAMELFDRALAVEPRYPKALNNKGLLLGQIGSFDEAMKCFEEAIDSYPDYIEALVNIGNLLQKQSRYERALPFYQRALRLHPALDFVPGHIAHCRAMLCEWSEYRNDWTRIEKLTQAGHLAASPFAFLTGSDRADLALKLARKFSEVYVTDLRLQWMTTSERRKSPKLRVGYVSSDFREHPMAYLMVGVMEHHDRESFEWIGIAIGQPGDDPLAKRILKTFDQILDVSAMSDTQAVQKIRELNLDIAIDLNGYIDGCRPSIFKARVAPLQVSYYGFPGTSGADFIDYIIGDQFLMPDGFEHYYSEKIIYLGGSYQPNDDQRKIQKNGKSRRDYGLPEDGFVFCCLNKSYKISPDIYKVWMQILQQVPNSVLWLFVSDNVAKNNLLIQTERFGVDPSRVIFTGRVPLISEHLARYCLADLFLDTFPYTAHTTANDALWAGLPVLSLSGHTFSARVGESLLGALGLQHWVARSYEEYRKRAIELALNQDTLQACRQELAAAKEMSSLYKPNEIAQMLEEAYRLIHERALNSLSPEHVMISAPN